MLIRNLLFILGTIANQIGARDQQKCSERYSIGALISRSDIVLKGHQKELLWSTSFTQCSLRCVEKNWCISVNFENTKLNGECELNDYGVVNDFSVSVDSGEFEERKGFIYSQLRPSKFGCHNNACSNGGTCSIDCNAWHKTQCNCPKGFRGSRCDEVDKCASNPCQNGGTCNDKDSRYTCTCEAGFSGTHCEQNIDECLSKPCLNNGTCTDAIDGYSCNCSPGFHGQNCQYDACGLLPCKNGATCSLSGVGGFSCACVVGFKGIACEVVDSAECTTYTNITDLTRNVNYGKENRQCDSNSFSGWYRLTGNAGVRMPTACVPKYRCNTDAPGWLKDQHPTIQQGITTKRVCFSWTDNCCEWFEDIRVRNCAAYFVYEFKKLYKCYLRYCGTK